MTSQDDRYARRLAEIRAQEAALDAEAAAAKADDDGDAHRVVRERSRGGKLRSALVLLAAFVVGMALIGVAVTLSRLAGRDMGDTVRTGQATVSSCQRHGPITTKGYGYWESCEASIKWDDGQEVRDTVSAVFTSADVGRTVEVGDAGRYRQSQELARADTEERPWLRWIGYLVGAIGAVPLVLLGILFSVRGRRR